LSVRTCALACDDVRTLKSTLIVQRSLHVRLVLREWGVTALSDRVELAVSELITNAVAASQSLDWVFPVRLWLFADRARVLIAVWDANPRLPVRVDANELAESGRGLQLVDTIATHWDAYATPQAGGKIVRAMCAMEKPAGAQTLPP
jgi:anti-sigma regulatory factor (Ser/Thr protein kinase)